MCCPLLCPHRFEDGFDVSQLRCLDLTQDDPANPIVSLPRGKPSGRLCLYDAKTWFGHQVGMLTGITPWNARSCSA